MDNQKRLEELTAETEVWRKRLSQVHRVAVFLPLAIILLAISVWVVQQVYTKPNRSYERQVKEVFRDIGSGVDGLTRVARYGKPIDFLIFREPALALKAKLEGHLLKLKETEPPEEYAPDHLSTIAMIESLILATDNIYAYAQTGREGHLKSALHHIEVAFRYYNQTRFAEKKWTRYHGTEDTPVGYPPTPAPKAGVFCSEGLRKRKRTRSRNELTPKVFAKVKHAATRRPQAPETLTLYRR